MPMAKYHADSLMDQGQLNLADADSFKISLSLCC